MPTPAFGFGIDSWRSDLVAPKRGSGPSRCITRKHLNIRVRARPCRRLIPRSRHHGDPSDNLSILSPSFEASGGQTFLSLIDVASAFRQSFLAGTRRCTQQKFNVLHPAAPARGRTVFAPSPPQRFEQGCFTTALGPTSRSTIVMIKICRGLQSF